MVFPVHRRRARARALVDTATACFRRALYNNNIYLTHLTPSVFPFLCRHPTTPLTDRVGPTQTPRRRKNSSPWPKSRRPTGLRRSSRASRTRAWTAARAFSGRPRRRRITVNVAAITPVTITSFYLCSLFLNNSALELKTQKVDSGLVET